VPIFVTDGRLDADTAYPQTGYVACEVLSTSQDEQGRTIAQITTARPYSIEFTDAVSDFLVLSEQLSSFGNPE
jgi:hypothetical protein